MVRVSFHAEQSGAADLSADTDKIIRLSLSQCLNPGCLASNPDHADECHHCRLPLQLAGRYRAVQTLGTRKFASTFRAVDEHRFGTPCVIKQLLMRQEGEDYQKAADLFTQEAVLLKDLGSHPQIPELMAFLTQGNHLYIVQQFIEGQNLLQDYEQRGRLTEVEACEMLKSLLRVLQFVHERQVIHRDIKPSNIIRRTDGSLVLIDFGSSHQSYTHLHDRRTPQAATPGYAAPEQMRGRIFPNSDLFSLGLTCLRLMTGCFPDDEGVDPLFDERQQKWRYEECLKMVSPELRPVFARLLQPDASKRYVSAQTALEDLVATLERFLEADWETFEPDSIWSYELENRSESAADYEQLRSLLAAQNYLEADQETWRLLLCLAHRTEQGQLTLDAIEFIPHTCLETIDDLWQTYSQGRFGLGIQQQLYRELGGSANFDFALWERFAEKVGWYRDGRWLSYAELTFADRAAAGHLPTCCIDPLNRQGGERGVQGWWRLGFATLMEHIESCQNARDSSIADIAEPSFFTQAL